MRRRAPWLLFALAGALGLVGLVGLAQVPAATLERYNTSGALEGVYFAVLLTFGAVGALIAARLPRHPVGWMFLVTWLLHGIYLLGFGSAQWALAGEGAEPGWAPWAAWLGNAAYALEWGMLLPSLLVFPDGRLPSRRWRPVLWAAIAILGLTLAQAALASERLTVVPALENPAGSTGASWLADVPAEDLLFLLIVAAAASLVVRFRRSHGIERQQLKWFVAAAGLVGAFLLAASLPGIPFDYGATEGSDRSAVLFAILMTGVPVAVGVAILRHRLYDVDLVINRALVYGALTAILAGTYLGLVLLAGLAVGRSSDLAIAASTLAVAALFRPVRARVQGIVDRRFYRRRYDAARTLEAFGGRLRDEIDLEALGVDLRGVVRETVQPTHVSLWLRETGAAR